MIERGYANVIGTLHQLEASAVMGGENNLSNAISKVMPTLASSYQVVRKVFEEAGFKDITPFSDSDKQAGIEVHETPFNSMFIGVLRQMHEQFLDANALLAARANLAASNLDAKSLIQHMNHMRTVGDAWLAVEGVFKDPKVLDSLHIINPNMPEGRSGRRDRVPTSLELAGASFVQQAQDTVRDEILSTQAQLLALPKDIRMEEVMTLYNAYGNFGSLLRRFREDRNLEQVIVANMAGCTISAISGYERGTIYPSPAMLHTILGVLRIYDNSTEGMAISMKYVFSAPTKK